jgi:hypothetical protein
MGFNGSGIFSFDSPDAVYDTVISETYFNNILAELETALSLTIQKDGQALISQNIPFNAKRITNLGDATALLDAINGNRVISNYFNFATSIGGTADAITLGTVSPTNFTYTQGLQVWFVPTAANTGSATVNINSLGVKSITRTGTTALSPGDIQSGVVTGIVYDGTQFQLVTPYYAQGNWTPSVGGTATYTNQTGRWVKNGRVCHFMGDMTITTIGTGSTSVISGLPYACANVLDIPVTIGIFGALTSNVVWIGGNVVLNTSTVQLRHLTAAGAAPVTTAILGNGSRICVSGSYNISV